MQQTHKQQLGRSAEETACKLLQTNGLTLLEKNFRCKMGEIDLIMQDGDHIVFVEVRSRSRTDYGKADESINRIKKNKIIKTATYYLQYKRWLNSKHGRFDVVAIHFVRGSMTLDWYKSAFLAG